MSVTIKDVDYAQLFIDGFETAVLTEEEKNFLNELVHGVDGDGQPINGSEAVRRSFGTKSRKAQKTRAYKVLNGGASTSDDTKLNETQLKKKAAVNAYLARLYQAKRRETRITEAEVIDKARRVFDIAIGDETTNQTYMGKDGSYSNNSYATNLPTAKSAAELLGKLGGFLNQKFEIVDPYADMSDEELEALAEGNK